MFDLHCGIWVLLIVFATCSFCDIVILNLKPYTSCEAIRLQTARQDNKISQYSLDAFEIPTLPRTQYRVPVSLLIYHFICFNPTIYFWYGVNQPASPVYQQHPSPLDFSNLFSEVSDFCSFADSLLNSFTSRLYRSVSSF